MNKARPPRWTVFVLVLAVLLAACDAVELPEGTGPGATDTPEATEPSPDPTEAPPATEAPGEGDEEGLGSEAFWILLGVLLVFLFIGWMMGRARNKQKAPVAAPVATWRDHARDGYSDARWLYDGLTEDLAIWRGNALFEGSAEKEATAASALADRWSQLDTRLNRATDSLYRAEAGSPDQNTAETIRRAVAALTATRSAVDARAEARLNSRKVDAIGQAQAAERERIASSTLDESRQELSQAVTALSALS